MEETFKKSFLNDIPRILSDGYDDATTNSAAPKLTKMHQSKIIDSWPEKKACCVTAIETLQKKNKRLTFVFHMIFKCQEVKKKRLVKVYLFEIEYNGQQWYKKKEKKLKVLHLTTPSSQLLDDSKCTICQLTQHSTISSLNCVISHNRSLRITRKFSFRFVITVNGIKKLRF